MNEISKSLIERETRIFKRRLKRFLRHIKERTLRARLIEINEQKRKEKEQERALQSWQSYPSTGKSFVFTLPEGMLIHLYKDDRLSENIYQNEFELNERLFMQHYLAPNYTFIDVGANIGLFTMIAAKAVGDEGRVISFEPCKKTFRRLKENIKLNGFTNIRLYHLALSDRNEKKDLLISKGIYSAWNSFAVPTAPEKRFNKEKIQTITWDSFVKEHNINRANLMKIDVEGWEYFVLQGGKTHLSTTDAPDIVIEFTEANARSAGVSLLEVFNLLLKLGYQIYRFDAKQKLFTIEEFKGDYPYDNLFATKNIQCISDRLGYVVTKE